MLRDSPRTTAGTDAGGVVNGLPPEQTAPGDESADILSAAPAGPAELLLALAVVLASLVFFVGLVPFAKQPLPQVWAFIPVYQSALVIVDLMTALLLLGQFRIGGAKSLLVLACGYFFTASVAVVHALSFPGLFASGGLLGATPQSTA